MTTDRFLDDVVARLDRFGREPDDRVRRVRFDLAGHDLTRGQVEERFGAHTSWSPGQSQVADAYLRYGVEVPGVPYRVTVSTMFDVEKIVRHPRADELSADPSVVLDGPDVETFLGIPGRNSLVEELVAERVRIFQPGEAHPGMEVLPDLLRTWAERVCYVPPGGPEQTLAALGIEGTVRRYHRDVEVEPPPPGIAVMRLSVEKGAPVDLLHSLSLTLLDSTLTRADLDVRFGRGQLTLPLHFVDDRVVHYRVESAGAPHACCLDANFREMPTGSSVIHQVELRRTDAPDTPSTDEAALAFVIDRLFHLMSFEPGDRPYYDWLADLFIEDGRIIRGTAHSPEVSTVEEFVADRQRAFDSGVLTSFRQVEISARTEVFGNVAHRFSTYEKREVRDGVGYRNRGVLSAQFIWNELGGWQMSSLACSDGAQATS